RRRVARAARRQEAPGRRGTAGMSERTPLIAGNWKMHRLVSESVALARAVLHRLDRASAAEVVVAPVFTSLHAVHEALGENARVKLGAQDVFWEDEGAFTGEASAPLLKDVGCEHGDAGHAERRQPCGAA